MKRTVLMFVILGAASLYSGVVTIGISLRDCIVWYRTPAADREDLILGPYAPVVRNVRANVPDRDAILLVTDIDPAPLPYALFPRRIWQMQTEPETNAVFMDQPPAPYLRRVPETLPVSWRLDFLETNAERGGELTRLGALREDR